MYGFSEILDRVIVGPPQLLLEILLSMIWQLINQVGLSIIILAVVMALPNLFLFQCGNSRPKEKTKQGPKKTVSQIFRSTGPLFVEVVLFFAAFRFFSDLQLLKGNSFGLIADLSMPDSLITIGSSHYHLLPVIVTGFGLAFVLIYGRNQPRMKIILLYVLTILCAAALYEAPSGMVLYWTAKVLFSLGWILLSRFRHRGVMIRSASAVAGIVLILYFAVFRPVQTAQRQALVIAAGLLLILPAGISAYRSHHPGRIRQVSPKEDRITFFAACLAMAVLTGAVIPAAVIRLSPDEFVDLEAYRSPLLYVLNTVLLSAGVFLLWCPVLRALSKEKYRGKFIPAAAGIMIISVMDYLFFGKNYGNMSALLEYDKAISVNSTEILMNSAVIILLAALVYLIWKKEPIILRVICLVECVVLISMSVMDLIVIRQSDLELREEAARPVNHNLRIPMDKKEKNVIVLMMDRAISGFIPYILEEKPELQSAFEGFVYYPDTISFGPNTNSGSPSLFGGYDYTPEKMNARNDVLLMDKHNEALKIMPLNFLNAGYEVTVCDASLANYRNRPDMSIYSEWPEIHRFNVKGKFSEWADVQREEDHRIRNRNFFCYSIFRSAPSALQTKLYNMGFYNETDRIPIEGVHREIETSSQLVRNPVQAQGLHAEFLYSYDVMTRLPELTDIQDTGKGTFLMMSNEITHEPALLQEPDYEPAVSVDNTDLEKENPPRRTAGGTEMLLDSVDKMTNYHANMAMMLQLAKWLNHLKNQGVYDNTRIIIVSDHGLNLGMFNLQMPDIQEEYGDLMFYNPLLLVKDFDSHGVLKTDSGFMTNADTPYLAFDGLIAEPQNPFLGTLLSDEEKNRPEHHILFTPWNFLLNNGYTFLGNEQVPNVWLTLKGNDLFDLTKWHAEAE